MCMGQGHADRWSQRTWRANSNGENIVRQHGSLAVRWAKGMHGYMAAQKKGENPWLKIDARSGKIHLGIHPRGRKDFPGLRQRCLPQPAERDKLRFAPRSPHRAAGRSYGLVAKQAPPAEAASTNFCTAGAGISNNCAFGFFACSMTASCSDFHESEAG